MFFFNRVIFSLFCQAKCLEGLVSASFNVAGWVKREVLMSSPQNTGVMQV